MGFLPRREADAFHLRINHILNFNLNFCVFLLQDL